MNKTTLKAGFLGLAIAATGPALAMPTDITIRTEGLKALERLETGMSASLRPRSEDGQPAGNVMKPAVYTPGGVGFSIDQDQDASPRVPTLRSF